MVPRPKVIAEQDDSPDDPGPDGWITDSSGPVKTRRYVGHTAERSTTPSLPDSPHPDANPPRATGADETAYILSLDRDELAVRVVAPKGSRVTYGPLAGSGKFPACFRLYEGKECIYAMTGVTGFRKEGVNTSMSKVMSLRDVRY